MAQRTSRLTPTTKSVDDLYELFKDGRLDLTPDYQRNSVWPPKARAYLVDTILMDLPIPMLFLYKYHDLNTNRMYYRVIDGQQRLRAAFAFKENRFSTTESKVPRIANKRFRRLGEDDQAQFMAYSFVVMELLNFDEDELRDIFARINRYVVRLSPQELRDAEHPGPFKEYVDDMAAERIWLRSKIVTASHQRRKRDKEFIAELTILMLEGPQDKKGSVDLYYRAQKDQFDEGKIVKERLLSYVVTAVGLVGSRRSIYHKHPVFYGLVGALVNLSGHDEKACEKLKDSFEARRALEQFALTVKNLPEDLDDVAELAQTDSVIGLAYKFQKATARQTDNINPRLQTISVLESLLANVLSGNIL